MSEATSRVVSPPSSIFTSADLGPLRLRNRVLKAATFEGRTPDAVVTDELIDFHVAHAEGGVAMTTVAYCAVSEAGRTDRHQIWMRPEAVPGLRRLASAVHATGALVSAQIGHAGPVANAASNRLPAIAPSRLFSPLGMAIVQRPDAGGVRAIVRAHAEAARYAVEAEFDAVEVHFGHNYLVSAFMSPLLNRRRDGYGGDTLSRARLAREISEAIRLEVGDQIAVIAKLNMDDGVPGGLRPDESIRVAQLLEQDGYLDALELTVGSSLLNPMYYFRGAAPRREMAATMPPPVGAGMRLVGRAFLREYPYEPMYLMETARRFRRQLAMPLVYLGGVTDAEGMDAALAAGFEYVAMGRALLREPDLLRRIARDSSVRSACIHCNKCMPTIFTRTRCPFIPVQSDRRA